MKDLITKLATLLGLDAVALTAEGADLAPMLTKAADEIGAGRKAVDGVKSFLSGVKDALSLKDTDTLEIAAGTVMSLSAKAKADALALTDAQAKLADHVKADKQRLIDSLKAEGKLTEAMATNWAPGLDIVALTDWAKHAPVIVPGGKTVKPGDKPADDTLTLTDNDIRIARACGMDPDKVKKTKLPVHE